MDKGTILMTVIMASLVLLAAYHALFPVPAYIAFTRFLALGGFMLLCVSLILGPMATFSPQIFGQMVMQRRAIGLAAFVFIIGHFLVSFLMEYNLQLAVLFAGIPMLAGTMAFALMVVLAITSTDWAVKKIPNWKWVQRLSYVVFLLSFVHFLFQAQGLFVKAGNQVFVNAAEIAMIVLGGITVGVQSIGFLIVSSRKAAAQAAKAAPAGSEKEAPSHAPQPADSPRP